MSSRADALEVPAPPPTVFRRAAGVLVGAVVWLWLKTLRLTVEAHPALDGVAGRPWVLSFWHGAQMPLLAWPRRRSTVALVSLSSDGELLAAALGVLGVGVTRGSSSRGGARGLAAAVRRARAGDDLAFAVDGPRGPARASKPGARRAARRAGAALVPMAAAASPATRLGSWDAFAVPWPFARIAVVLGAPIEPAADVDLDAAIEAADARARALVGAG